MCVCIWDAIIYPSLLYYRHLLLLALFFFVLPPAPCFPSALRLWGLGAYCRRATFSYSLASPLAFVRALN